MNKTNYLKFSLVSLTALLLSFGCNTYTVNTNNQIKSSNNALEQNKESIYNFYFDGNNKTEKNNIKIKFNLDKSFNTKAQIRKTASDITNLEVALCNSGGTIIGSPFTINYNSNSDLRTMTVNIKNLPSGTYYARVIAKDSGNDGIAGNGDDNILNQNGSFDISSNYIIVDLGLNLQYPNDKDLVINLNLKDAAKNSTEFYINNAPSLSQLNIALDEKGNGLMYAQIAPKQIYVIRFVNYVPTSGSGTFDFSPDGSLVSIGSITASFTNGKGSLVFVKNYSANSQLYNKQFTISEKGVMTDTSETLIETNSGANSYNSLNIKLDSKGDGTLVVSKKDATTKYNIYTVKYVSYLNSGTSSIFFQDGQSDKTKPVVSINNKGDGAVIWEDDASGIKEIAYAKLGGYTNYGNGTINSTFSNISGTGTTFTNNFQNTSTKYLRVENNVAAPLLQVQTISGDTVLTTSSSQTFTGKKYATLLSTNDTNSDYAPTIKTNISGEGLVVWKNQISNTFTIKGIKLNTFNPNSNPILGGPVFGFITDIDSSPPGLALNTNGDGYVIFSLGASTTSRNMYKSTFSNYALANPTTFVKAGDNLFAPVIALNNSGSGIIVYSFNNPTLQITGLHLKEYIN